MSRLRPGECPDRVTVPDQVRDILRPGEYPPYRVTVSPKARGVSSLPSQGFAEGPGSILLTVSGFRRRPVEYPPYRVRGSPKARGVSSLPCHGLAEGPGSILLSVSRFRRSPGEYPPYRVTGSPKARGVSSL